jgi:type I restriction enzyme S subunit
MLSPYPEYKDSGVDWLGLVPSHWEVNKVGRVSKSTVGWTPPTGDAESFVGDNLWANISDLGPRVVTDTAKRISDKAVSTSRIKMSPAGSLLFSFKLSVGQVSFAGADLYTNEAIATFFETSAVTLAYAYYAFPRFIVENAGENIYGAKILNQSLIRGAKIALPPVAEQHAIAKYLDRETAEIDAFIADQNHLIDLLYERRSATVSQAVTQGLDPLAPMRDSGAQQDVVPQHWDAKKLGWLFKIGNGSTPSSEKTDYWSDGSIPWLNSSCVNLDRVVYPSKLVTPLAVSECHLPKVRSGSLLIALTGQGKTRGMVAELMFDSTINQHMAYLTPIADTVDVPFVKWRINSAYDELRFISEGNGGTKGALTCGHLQQFKIALPPLSEQRAIAEYLDRETNEIDAAVTEAREAIELSQERRSALIFAAVTGKIDVRSRAKTVVLV